MSKKIYYFSCIGILTLHLILLAFYGTQKHGFYMDEYYSYFTSSGNLSPYPYSEPFQEVSGSDLQEQFQVTGGHRFDFGTVTQIQSNDVHPPLYYLTLNALMSFFPGRFSKWFGIALNSFYSLITCFAVMSLILRLDRGKYKYILSAVAGLSYAVCPAIISCVMFTRMYAMSAMWTVIYANIFARLTINGSDMSRRQFSVLTFCGALVCYFSFLTHYFCLFPAFFLTLGYCIRSLLRRSGLARMLSYGGAMTAAVALAVLTYPASLSQIFTEYRGKGAISSFIRLGLLECVRIYEPIINKYFYAGLLGFILVGLIISAVMSAIILYRAKTGAGNITVIATAVAMVSCLITVYLLCRTSLFSDEFSCRFFYPVMALFIPLTVYCVCKPWFTLNLRARESNGSPKARQIKILPPPPICRGICILVAAAALFPFFKGLAQENVLFLYKGKITNLNFARENTQYPAIILYNDESRYRAWFLANELWQYEKLIYIEGNQEAYPESETLKNAQKAIVYISGPEDWLIKLTEQYPHLGSYTLVDLPFETDYFAIFELKPNTAQE